MIEILKSKPFVLALVVLAAEFVGARSIYRGEYVPEWRPLTDFDRQVGEWVTVRQTPLTKEVLDELKADDTLSRDYLKPGAPNINLYVAFFRTQRTSVAPHSPKHCLPANGFLPVSSDIVQIPVSGQDKPIPINRYIVAKGADRVLVLYWYQTAHGVEASELRAKIRLVTDSIRYHRSDTSLVRLVVPITAREQDAEKEALAFLHALYPALKVYLPGPQPGAA